MAADSLAYHLGWHDWLNLKSLLLVSRAVVAAASAREDSRGAHFRADFPDCGPLEASEYTRVSLSNDTLVVERRSVEFSRVQPGTSLIDD